MKNLNNEFVTAKQYLDSGGHFAFNIWQDTSKEEYNSIKNWDYDAVKSFIDPGEEDTIYLSKLYNKTSEDDMDNLIEFVLGLGFMGADSIDRVKELEEENEIVFKLWFD